MPFDVAFYVGEKNSVPKLLVEKYGKITNDTAPYILPDPDEITIDSAATSSCSNSPSTSASLNEDAKATKSLQKYAKEVAPWMIVPQEAKQKLICTLIELGANVQLFCDNNWPLLHYASRVGWLQVVQSLLKEGADVNAKAFRGRTALHLAVEFRKFKVAKCLLAAGADSNITDDQGFSTVTEIILDVNDSIRNEPRENTLKEYPLLVVALIICLENGAYLHTRDYFKVRSNIVLTNIFLRKIPYSVLAIINQFNNRDLPEVYRKVADATKLPPIDFLKITSRKRSHQEVIRTVTEDIKDNGLCNFMRCRPMVLSILAVRSFLNYCHSKNAPREISVSAKRVRDPQSATYKRLCVREQNLAYSD